MASRVLIAEDNLVNQMVARGLVLRLGYEVGVAGNGREVLAALGSESYALVLMDCQMPEMDGYQATAAIRASEAAWRKIPILAMTTSTESGDRARCLEAGMNGFVAKPLKAENLADALQKWLLVDHQALDEIRELGPSLLAELLETFAKLVPARVLVMRQAIAELRVESVRFEAHALKSASGNLGATGMAAVCAALEATISLGDGSATSATIDQLEREFTAYMRAVRSVEAA